MARSTTHCMPDIVTYLHVHTYMPRHVTICMQWRMATLGRGVPPPMLLPICLWNTDPIVLYRCKVPGQRIGHGLDHTTQFVLARWPSPRPEASSQKPAASHSLTYSFSHPKLPRKTQSRAKRCRYLLFDQPVKHCAVL